MALLAVATLVRANGDPVAEWSALTLARRPVAVHVPEVQLLDERTHFTLRDGYVEVEVHYLLCNRSDRDFHALPYGFPVDWLGDTSAHWESSVWSSSLVERGWRDSFVRDVMFSLDGQSLPWQRSADTVLQPRRAVCDTDFITEVLETGQWVKDPLLAPDLEANHYSEARTREIVDKYGDSILYYAPALRRCWYYVRLDIPARRTVELVVRYSIETNVEESLYFNTAETYNAVFRSTSGQFLQWCMFRYDFSPAAYWGDGRVQRFLVEVDTAYFRSSCAAGRRNIHATGLPLRKAERSMDGRGENCLVYESRNFDLADAEPLEITYFNDVIHENVADLLSRRISPDHYTITVSGEDPRYPVDNLSDLDLATATVLRPGVPPKIETDVFTKLRCDSLYLTVTFHDSTLVTGLVLYNGYCKDKQMWLNNSRIDTLHYHYASRLWDKPYVDIREGYVETPREFTWQGLTDAAIKMPVEGRHVDHDFPWGYNERRFKLKSITICITSTTRGLRYDDLCISELVVLGD